MQIHLHAGPMKTGSTAFQRALAFAEPELVRAGLLPRTILITNPLLVAGRAAEQREFLVRLFDEAARRECTRLLISSEFLCAIHDPGTLAWIAALVEAGHGVDAVLVRRPWAELYPSLYLQNLKGPNRRVTSFADFVTEQLEIDTRTCWERNGTSFNYRCLRQRLEDAGARVEVVDYSRSTLVADVLRAFWLELPLTPERLRPTEEWMEHWRAELRENGKMDHSRSLSFSLAPAALVVNRLCREGALDDAHRDRILIELLDASAGTTSVPESERELLEKVARVDSEVHGDRAAR